MLKRDILRRKIMKAKKIVTLLVAAALTCGVVGGTTSVYAADVTLKLAHADAEGSYFCHFQCTDVS